MGSTCGGWGPAEDGGGGPGLVVHKADQCHYADAPGVEVSTPGSCAEASLHASAHARGRFWQLHQVGWLAKTCRGFTQQAKAPCLASVHRQLASNVLQRRLQAAQACTRRLGHLMHQATLKCREQRRAEWRRAALQPGPCPAIWRCAPQWLVPRRSPSATASGPVDRYTSPNRCSRYQNMTAFHRPRLRHWQAGFRTVGRCGGCGPAD